MHEGGVDFVGDGGEELEEAGFAGFGDSGSLFPALDGFDGDVEEGREDALGHFLFGAKGTDLGGREFWGEGGESGGAEGELATDMGEGVE